MGLLTRGIKWEGQEYEIHIPSVNENPFSSTSSSNNDHLITARPIVQKFEVLITIISKGKECDPHS